MRSLKRSAETVSSLHSPGSDFTANNSERTKLDMWGKSSIVECDNEYVNVAGTVDGGELIPPRTTSTQTSVNNNEVMTNIREHNRHNFVTIGPAGKRNSLHLSSYGDARYAGIDPRQARPSYYSENSRSNASAQVQPASAQRWCQNRR